MEYAIEELLPIVAWLSNKYTSKESSSIPYETAQMLLGAVTYCLDEAMKENVSSTLVVQGENGVPLEKLYHRGYALVVEKMKRAKSIYDEICLEFEDYGVHNYRDTLRKGIPAFFVKYNPLYCPQEHFLTMDYPLRYGLPKECGVDLIYTYLQEIRKEQKWLSVYPRERVIACLEETCGEYEELFLDNIYDAVERMEDRWEKEGR